MFGRNREEDYDAYNERVNARYDDDYIRPSEESRRECSHDHEQTYKNYESKQTYKNAESKQTYKDYNAEQSVYDNFNSIEDKFTSHLRQGEMIVWLGQTEKKAKAKERGAMGCILIFPIMWILFSFITLISSLAGDASGILSSLLFIAIGVVILKVLSGIGKGVYAITDQRVMAITGGNFTSTELTHIMNIDRTDSDRHIGSLTFRLAMAASGQTAKCTGFYGIKNPTVVQGILHNAIVRRRGWNTNY